MNDVVAEVGTAAIVNVNTKRYNIAFFRIVFMMIPLIIIIPAADSRRYMILSIILLLKPLSGSVAVNVVDPVKLRVVTSPLPVTVAYEGFITVHTISSSEAP